MISGKQAAIGGAVIMLLAVGSELAWLHHEHDEPGTLPPAATAKADPDELVFLKQQRPSSLADVKQLAGTTVWMEAGGQLDYYPCAGHKADYLKPAGTLLGAEPLAIKDAFEQVAPKSANVRIQRGDKQVLLAFTMPKSDDPAKLYAVPVGYKQGEDYTFANDEIFFYDDPHVLFQHWGPKVWQAVDAHQVILGMNERQVGLALGQLTLNQGKDYGNRTVVYDNLGKPMAVTFVNDQVTEFHHGMGGF
jgi:hypothetical protein